MFEGLKAFSWVKTLVIWRTNCAVHDEKTRMTCENWTWTPIYAVGGPCPYWCVLPTASILTLLTRPRHCRTQWWAFSNRFDYYLGTYKWAMVSFCLVTLNCFACTYTRIRRGLPHILKMDKWAIPDMFTSDCTSGRYTRCSCAKITWRAQ